MYEENYQFLTRVLAKMGFEDKLNDALRTNMQLERPSFALKAMVKHGNDQMIHELHFDKKDEKAYYFLNEQHVTLKKENQEEIRQKFPLFNQRGFNNDEVYNLMNGRSVRNKVVIEGKESIRWTHIDFNSDKNKNGNYVFRNAKEEDINFSLARAVSKLSIYNLDQDNKEDLLKGLQAGNLESVMVRHNGERERVYLEASPRTNSITVYNSQMQRVHLTDSKILVLKEDLEKVIPDKTKELMAKEHDPELTKGKQKTIK